MSAVPGDVAALAPLLEERLPALGRGVTIAPFGGGQSNPTFLALGSGGEAVLRVQPAGKRLKGAHAVDREFRVMAALHGSRVPVPEMLLSGGEDEWLDRRFIVMQRVEGVVFWDPALPDKTPAERGRVYDAMVTVLADLHDVDIASVGLSDYGRPGNYFARQFATWQRQYRASETGENRDMEQLIAWLDRHLPEDDGTVSLVHGDYRIDNLIFDPEVLAIRAVLDWELSTLGHPFADLAYQCMQWRLPNDGVFKGLGGVDREALGIPDEAAYLAAYCRRRGLARIEGWTFHLAFSFFRLAAILQGIYRRYLDGNAANAETALRYGQTVPVLTALAMAEVERGG
ncbi:phosphotransferase family protein [Stappia taiwanensis]|uniref:Phosphotransferase family protein n=1 Tax=Stappia taiwanensis TaxID=992267 RepID=A0A838XSD6_9HYPH|nr:phosphotransferase family protein [Stappia taiwanensis]MBA4611446.1 phosphotransferase family protein [Stappia taiwanensis]GGF00239.1 aminoglycoside phosphotransferase [Stappia taiwanensis]